MSEEVHYTVRVLKDDSKPVPMLVLAGINALVAQFALDDASDVCVEITTGMDLQDLAEFFEDSAEAIRKQIDAGITPREEA